MGLLAECRISFLATSRVGLFACLDNDRAGSGMSALHCRGSILRDAAFSTARARGSTSLPTETRLTVYRRLQLRLRLIKMIDFSGQSILIAKAAPKNDSECVSKTES